jgi:hypothetical protein
VNHAILWQRHELVELGDLGGGESLATYINNAGQITGISDHTMADPFSLFGLTFQVRTSFGTMATSKTSARSAAPTLSLARVATINVKMSLSDSRTQALFRTLALAFPRWIRFCGNMAG